MLRFARTYPLPSLFALVFFLSTWDLVLTRTVGGFHLKAYQLVTLALAAVTGLGCLRAPRNLRAIDGLLAPLRLPFALAMLSLLFWYLGSSPWSAFPLKSFLYSCWLGFDLLALWLCAFHALERAPDRFLPRVVFATLLFLSVIILVDYAAYPFGYRGGFIGWNQDAETNLMVSRPHAFTSEPSYAACFLCFGLFTVAPFLLRQSRRKGLAVAGIALVVFAVVATTSRTGWAALALGTALLAAVPALGGRRIPWKAIGVFFAALPVLFGLFLVFTPTAQRENLNQLFVQKFFKGDDSSGNARLKALVLARDFARDTNGLGTGLGASYKYYRDHGGFDVAHQDAFQPRDYGNEVIMSTWGQLLGEGGPLAVLLYLAAAVALVRALARKWKATGDPLAYGALASALLFFTWGALWLGNVCRGDVWVWFAIWSWIASPARKAPAA